MGQFDSISGVRQQRRAWRAGRHQRLALWPQGPLAAVLGLIGILNIIGGLKLPLPVFLRTHTVSDLADSLSALGGTMQALLGFLLVVAGIGLLWRLVSAWTLAVLLLLAMLGINIVRSQWGVHFVLQALMLGALFFFKRRFTRRTMLANSMLSLSGILAVLMYGVFGSFLLGNEFQPPIRDFETATYFAITTLSTVGFGDFVPNSPEARWFVVSLLVIGLGVFASAIVTVFGPKLSRELNRLLNPKENIMDLNNHVILVGDGAIARNTAKELKRRGLVFVHVLGAKAAAPPDEDRILVGDATSEAVLRQAGVDRARMVIAAQEDDGENAFIVLGAKELNPKVRVMAVASSSLSIRRLKLARADLVFSPIAVGSRLLADLVEGTPISKEFQDLLEGHLPNRENP
ncbi:MAG: NAD-binding protein [Limisphaerales bacterium]